MEECPEAKDYYTCSAKGISAPIYLHGAPGLSETTTGAEPATESATGTATPDTAPTSSATEIPRTGAAPLPLGAAISVGVAGVVVMAALLVGVYYLRKRNRGARAEPQGEVEAVPQEMDGTEPVFELGGGVKEG